MKYIAINSDEQFVTDIKAKIRSNGGHCACAIAFTNENKCMCEEFKQRFLNGQPGYCHCGLYEVVVEED